jgi:hypothetical protein
MTGPPSFAFSAVGKIIMSTMAAMMKPVAVLGLFMSVSSLQ